MTTEKKIENPPAFPGETQEQPVCKGSISTFKIEQPGMTLRDYFAAKALNGIYAANHERATKDGSGEWVEKAYEIADAMLKQRLIEQNPNT